MKKISVFIVSMTLLTISCSYFQKGDPYAATSGPKRTSEGSSIVVNRGQTSTSNTNTSNVTSKSTVTSTTSSTARATEKVKENVTEIEKKETNKVITAKENKKTTKKVTVDETFDATDQKIVDFIAEKVKEDGEQIKKITIEGVNKLQNEKNIRMTKREFLARTYQIIRDNKMTSYYLASARLLNQMKK